MDIHSLKYFKKVADLQHITRAAEELHVAQPSLSRTISMLESNLGVRLFERKGKNIILNEYGKVVLHHTNRILQEMENIVRELSELKGEDDRSVTFSAFAASELLPQLLIAFKREYPSIRFHIIREDLHTKSDTKCDLSLYASTQPCKNKNEVMLIEEELLLALPDTNPLAAYDKINLQDVANMEFICLYKGKSLRTISDMYCKMANFEPKVVLECDSPETVRELIRAGLGISLIPSITWGEMSTKNIVLKPISYPVCRRYVHLTWNESAYLSPATILFKNFIKDYFKVLR